MTTAVGAPSATFAARLRYSIITSVRLTSFGLAPLRM
jgi:hypothetical protein